MKGVFFVTIACLLVTSNCVAQKDNSLHKNNVIYFMQQNFKKSNVKFGFINKSDKTRALISTKVIKDRNHAYVKFGADNYYLNVDSLPFASNDICSELKKITMDTALAYGEPLSRSVSVIFMIDKYGKIQSFGLTRGSNSSYYDNATVRVLEEYSKNNSFKPAKVDNDAVSSILRISFSFGHGDCVVLTNTPPFFIQRPNL